jgi:rubrerythrin
MDAHVKELLQQMHETEKGGVEIYRTALGCVVNDDLRKEWTEYLEQTQRHERVVSNLLEKLGLRPEETPGRKVVRHIGDSLVTAMKMAKAAGERDAAEIVATECVVFAETKDHMNWHLLSEVAAGAEGAEQKALLEACEEVEDEEDEHVYHSKGWCRELWMNSLGLDAVLPPPEEQKNVKSAIDAARAEQTREELK